MAVKLHSIKDSVYGSEIYLLKASYNEMTQYLNKRYEYSLGDIEHYPAGRVIKAFDTKNDWRTTKYFLWLNSFDYFTYDYSALVHEVIHLALMVFEAKGIPIIYDNVNGNEAFCYYADYLYEQFLLMIGKIKQVTYIDCKDAMDYMRDAVRA